MDQNYLVVRQWLGSLVGVAVHVMGTEKFEPLIIISSDKFHLCLTSTLIVHLTSEWSGPLAGPLVVIFFISKLLSEYQRVS